MQREKPVNGLDRDPVGGGQHQQYGHCENVKPFVAIGLADGVPLLG
jgi:hypothetical protein